MPAALVTSTAFAHRPLRVRLEISWGEWLRRRGKFPLPRDPEALLAVARSTTGLSDFGDPLFLEGYHRLHRALVTEARLHHAGERMVREMLLTHLGNRLQIEESARRIPSIRAEVIDRPIFILGMPRTGSTYLHRLMAADPAMHHLRFADALAPAPPPALSQDLEAARLARARGFRDAVARYGPRANALHPIGPGFPEECYFLLRNSFAHPSFQTSAFVPGFTRWVASQPQQPSYRDYRLQLRILQHGRPPGRWILKSISHWHALPALHETFPDACIVQIHRHPRAVIPSFVELMASARAVCSDQLIEPIAYARDLVGGLNSHLELLHRFRDGLSPDRQCDVHYPDLVRDPIATMRGLYERLGLIFSTAGERGMRGWLAANPAPRSPAPRHSLEDFGLSGSAVDAAFAAYLDRYGVDAHRNREPAGSLD